MTSCLLIRNDRNVSNNYMLALPQIIELRSLQNVDLSHNRFSGRFPSFMFAPDLNVLLFNNNNFTGPLPLSLPSQTRLTRIEGNDNQFSQIDIQCGAFSVCNFSNNPFECPLGDALECGIRCGAVCRCKFDCSGVGECNEDSGDCICGEGFDGQHCERCAVGFAVSSSSVSTTCSPCGAGTFWSQTKIAGSNVNIAVCNNCTAGKYNANLAQVRCSICGSSTYQPLPGSDSCVSCPSHSSHRLQGQTTAFACTCDPGYVSNYSTDSDAFECLACRTAKYWSAGFVLNVRLDVLTRRLQPCQFNRVCARQAIFATAAWRTVKRVLGIPSSLILRRYRAFPVGHLQRN